MAKVNVSLRQPSAGSPSDEDIPSDTALSHVGEEGSAGDEAPPSAAARAFLLLLRITALMTGHGWGHLAHTFLMLALSSAASVFTAWMFAVAGIEKLKTGQVAAAMAVSGFFGLTYVLMWTSIVCCFAFSRRRYGQQLNRLRGTVSRLAKISANSKLSDRRRRNVNWLFALAVQLIITTIGVVVYYGIYQQSQLTTMAALVCYDFTFSMFCTAFFLVPLKYVFAALYMQSGCQQINAQLRFLTARRHQPDPDIFRHLISLQDQLSLTFRRLTKSMSVELVMVMTNGTITSVSTWLLLVSSLQMGTFDRMVQVIGLFMLMTSVTVVLPSEATQRCLQTAGDSRDLLLTAENRHPQLGPQLSLLREMVGRDLDTLGDLGMFRLQRSTTLSITATVLTYVIVMVQFYVA